MKMQQAITKSVEHPGDLQPQELRARELARGPVLMRRVREQVEGVAVGGAHHPRAFRVVGGPGGGEAQLAESGEGVGIRPATTRMKEQLLHALAECERIVDASLRHGASQFSPCNTANRTVHFPTTARAILSAYGESAVNAMRHTVLVSLPGILRRPVCQF